MKKIVMFGLLSIFFGFYSHAQVKDISVTIAPTAEYTWWDNETILKDSPLVGGRVGFGFGRYFEIRGLYMKSMDLKGTLEDINWDYADDLAKDLEETKVDVTRWGGEMKANIGLNSWLAPYITLGTGVQTFEFKRENQNLDKYKEEQIYASAGLGAKINLSDRIVLALEGRNTVFNLNEGNPYLNPNFDPDGKDNRMYNWSALASLEFYLGGRNPNEMTDLDKAYRDSFKGGMKGFKFSLEPGGMYVDFDDESPFTDSYFLGGGIGVDVSDYIGLRGFYYQATKDGDLEFNFNDNLKMYGGNVIARLNHNTGVTPYLSLGGGYIDVGDSFTTEDGNIVKDGNGFAMGGLGIEIPLSKYILAYGSANYMMTTTKDVEAQDVRDPSELRSNVAYRAGIRFQIGGRSKNPQAILNRNMERRISEYDSRYNDKMTELRAEYENRIEKLNQELEKAYQDDDVEKAVTILEERKRNEKELRYAEGTRSNDREMVRMSRSEFEDLVDEVIRKIDNKEVKSGYENDRISQLEEALLQMNMNSAANADVNVDDANTKILEELRRLNNQVERNTDLINKSMLNNKQEAPAAIIVNPKTGETQKTVTRDVETEDGQKIEVVETRKDRLSFASEGFSAFTGPNFGDSFTWNIGLRSYHKVGESENFKFMPEAYLGFGDGTSFGLSANVLYQFNNKGKSKMINPYVGLGLGLFKQDDTSFGPNFIVGTELDVLDGKLFVDYSARNLFKNNQIAVGYRFTF